MNPKWENGDVAIYSYEKKPLLEAKDTKLKVIQNDKEVEKICATVKDGYAVAEIELRPKTDADFKKWLEEMGAHKKPSERKDTKLWIEVLADGIPITKKFLEDKPVKFISTNWHEPMDYPQRTKYSSSGYLKPKNGAFGKVRLYPGGGEKKHQGIDLFAPIGTKLYSCISGVVKNVGTYGDAGKRIVIEGTNTTSLKNRKLALDYEDEYQGEMEFGTGFEFEDKIYLFYFHLSEFKVKQGEEVKAGQLIGLSGVTGNADGIRNPHLHLEVLDTYNRPGGLTDKHNPAYFIDLKPIQDTLQEDTKLYKWYKDGTKKK